MIASPSTPANTSNNCYRPASSHDMTISSQKESFQGTREEQRPDNNNRQLRLRRGDATSFRRRDSERSLGSIGTSMRSLTNSSNHSGRSRRSKASSSHHHGSSHLLPRTSKRYLAKAKTVRFAKKLEQLEYIETVEEYTEHKKDALWFAAKDLEGCKKEAEALASLWEEHPKIAAQSAHPYRGLEDKTPDGHWQAYKARRDVLNAVLDLQDKLLAQNTIVHKTTSEDYPPQLAQASREITHASRPPALERGKEDAKFALGYCQETHEMRTMGQRKPKLSEAKRITEVATSPTQRRMSSIQESPSTQLATPKPSRRRKSITTLPSTPKFLSKSPSKSPRHGGIHPTPSSSPRKSSMDVKGGTPKETMKSTDSPRRSIKKTIMPSSPSSAIRHSVSKPFLTSPKSPKRKSTPRSSMGSVRPPPLACPESPRSRKGTATTTMNTDSALPSPKSRRHSVHKERVSTFVRSLLKGTPLTTSPTGGTKESAKRSHRRASLSTMNPLVEKTPTKPTRRKRRASTTGMPILESQLAPPIHVRDVSGSTETSNTSSGSRTEMSGETEAKGNNRKPDEKQTKSPNNGTLTKESKSKTGSKSDSRRDWTKGTQIGPTQESDVLSNARQTGWLPERNVHCDRCCDGMIPEWNLHHLFVKCLYIPTCGRA